MTVLVTGARGHIARSLITRLTSAGTPFRAASSRPGPGETLLDLSTGEGLGPALDGVDRVLLYTQPDGIDAFLDAARDVKHIVQVSSSAVDQPDAATNSIALRHKVVEDKLLASGLPVTVLRPGAFATNALQWWSEAIRAGSTVEDANLETQLAPIHQDDIAAVAQVLLADGGHVGEALALTGPESLTVRQQIEIIGEVLGREIPVAQISRQQALDRRPDYIPLPVMESLLDTFARGVGRPAFVSDAVRAVTGVPARTFRRWVEDHRSEFVARQG
jgi:uncharacterized protein YbjT (DUF2867 family)